MQPTNGHIMDLRFVNNPSSETGGRRCKSRCPSAAVVKRGLSQYSGEQCVTKTEGGPACVQTPGGPTVGWSLPRGRIGVYRLSQIAPVVHSPQSKIEPPHLTVRKWMLFNNPSELPFLQHITLHIHRFLCSNVVACCRATKPATCSLCINRRWALPVRWKSGCGPDPNPADSCCQMPLNQTITELCWIKISLLPHMQQQHGCCILTRC